ncbi:MAG: hypothetical protein Q7K57_08490 [Burkholderiaceae bacterium]|nr:hypothetical protein [Burkholderiaceae bacterium]
MVQPPFREWLAQKSWDEGVRYCRAVACLLQAATLALDAPLFFNKALTATPKWRGLLGWQLAVELACLTVVLTDLGLMHTPWIGRASCPLSQPVRHVMPDHSGV